MEEKSNDKLIENYYWLENIASLFVGGLLKKFRTM